MALPLLSKGFCNLLAVQNTAEDRAVETEEATLPAKKIPLFYNPPFLRALYFSFSVNSSWSCLSLNNYCYLICPNAISNNVF